MRSAWRAVRPAATVVPAAVARVTVTGSARILGLDPGSLRTGFGVIDCEAGNLRIVAQGCIATSGGPLADRLRMIHARVAELIVEHAPQEIAVERVFLSKNADSALKLGQARGAAMCAVVLRDLPISEYAAKEIKLAVVGTGGADKVQVQHMVGMMLGLQGKLQADAADALAVAITHAHVGSTARRLGVAANVAWRK